MRTGHDSRVTSCGRARALADTEPPAEKPMPYMRACVPPPSPARHRDNDIVIMPWRAVEARRGRPDSDSDGPAALGTMLRNVTALLEPRRALRALAAASTPHLFGGRVAVAYRE